MQYGLWRGLTIIVVISKLSVYCTEIHHTLCGGTYIQTRDSYWRGSGVGNSCNPNLPNSCHHFVKLSVTHAHGITSADKPQLPTAPHQNKSQTNSGYKLKSFHNGHGESTRIVLQS